MRQKIIAAAFAILLIVLFTGCGRKQGGDPIRQAISGTKNYVYRLEELPVTGQKQQVGSLLKAGEKFYCYGYSFTEDGKSSLHIYELSKEGVAVGSYEAVFDAGENMQSITMDEEGTVYGIRNVFGLVDEETGEYQDNYYLVRMTLEGKELFRVDLKSIPEIREIEEENGYFFADSMFRAGDGTLFVLCAGKVACFRPDGGYAGMVSWDGSTKIGGSYIQLADGRVVGVIYGGDGVQVAEVDFKAGTVGEEYKLPGNSYEYNLYPGIDYDIYMVNNYGVYGYNLGDTDKTQILSFLDSDLSIYALRDVVGTENGQFLAVYNEYNAEGAKVGRFTKVPPEEVKEKQIITLAMPYSDWEVRNMVADFNKKNEEYRITILDYSSLYNTDADWNAGINQMNMDIASGKMPDIVLLDNRMPVDSYRSKGLFEDLLPYIEEDKELDISDYMPNIIEAFLVKDKLYYLVPSYRIMTLFAKTSDVGDKQGWTVPEACALLDSKPEGTSFMGEMIRDNMLDNCMNMASSQFIDWESGKCYFDTEEFTQMLEFISIFPEKQNYDKMDDEYWNEYETMWRDGKVLTRSAILSGFREYNEIEKVTFGEDVTMIGFPTASGVGSVIYPDKQLVLSEKSKYKEGAWEFLRIFLTKDYQSKLTYTFPLRMEQMENQIAEAMKRPTYEDEFGNQIEYDDSYNINGVEITVTPISQEKADALAAQIHELRQVSKYDESLLNIIKEEAAPYFAGEKSAMDVAKIIQSRAQIYVYESR